MIRQAIVDRENREKLAKATVVFMCAKIRSDAYDDARREAKPGGWDAGLLLAKGVLWTCYSDLEDHAIRADHEEWNLMRRWVAFLMTDYPMCKTRVFLWTRRQTIALLFVAILAIAGVFSWYLGRWWVVACVWVPLGLLCPPPNPNPLKEGDAKGRLVEIKRLFQYQPFLSEEDWARHEHLLESFDLPEYDASAYEAYASSPEAACFSSESRWTVKVLVLLALPVYLIFCLWCCKYPIWLRTDRCDVLTTSDGRKGEDPGPNLQKDCPKRPEDCTGSTGSALKI